MKIILAHADPLVIGVALGLGLAELARRIFKGKKKLAKEVGQKLIEPWFWCPECEHYTNNGKWLGKYTGAINGSHICRACKNLKNKK